MDGRKGSAWSSCAYAGLKAYLKSSFKAVGRRVCLSVLCTFGKF